MRDVLFKELEEKVDILHHLNRHRWLFIQLVCCWPDNRQNFGIFRAFFDVAFQCMHLCNVGLPSAHINFGASSRVRIGWSILGGLPSDFLSHQNDQLYKIHNFDLLDFWNRFWFNNSLDLQSREEMFDTTFAETDFGIAEPFISGDRQHFVLLGVHSFQKFGKIWEQEFYA